MAQSTVAKVQAAARSRSSGATRLVQKNSFSATAGLVLDPEVRLPKGLAVSGSGTQPRSASLVSRSGQARSKQATAFLLPPCPKASGAAARTWKAKPGRALARRSQSRLVEVRGLSGETWIREEFALTDHVLCVKDCVQGAREVPPWQQMLMYQGQILEDHTKLSDLDIPTQEVVFEVVRRLSPTSEDREALSAARTALDEKMQLLDTLEPKRLVQISKFDHPSESVAMASVAALHMLSGSLACTGAPSNGHGKSVSPLRHGATWSCCRFMWADKEFVNQLKLLPDKIENGALAAWADRVQACRATISSLAGGEGDIEKLDYLRELGRQAWGRYADCEKVVEYLMAVLKYYDKIVQFREGFSGAAMDALLKEL